ncbi:MAG: class I SAM-dependent methyltransferase [Solirubrobacterales bacterium]
MASATEHPERFDPSHSSGTLMDAEHRCRYWWAAQAVAGKDVLDAGCGTGYGSAILAAVAATVTGVDISAEAVEEADRRLGEKGSVVQGDLRKLPFDDDSFDAVVCWETIEHIEDGSAVLAELRRVLRPDGLLLVSSPNPGVYQEDNEHHVHEYTPEELRALVGEQFPQLAEHVQHPWLASAIQPAESSVEDPASGSVKRIAEIEPGGQTYTIVVAGAGVPELPGLITLADSFEVRWWSDQLDAANERTAATERHVTEVEEHFGREVAAARAREHDLSVRLHEANGRLLRASEELSRLQRLEEHFDELKVRNENLSEHYDVAIAQLRGIEATKVWRLWTRVQRLRGR